jgi:hypothetical protein
VLSYEALADRVSADDLIKRVLDAVPRPSRPFEEEAAARREGA